MALNFGDILLAATEGGAKALSDKATAEREARLERVKERSKQIQELAIERAKTIHNDEYKKYTKREEAVMSSLNSSGYTRNYNFAKNVQGLDDDMAKAFASKAEREGWEVSDEELNGYLGQAPIFSYDLPKYTDKQLNVSEDEYTTLLNQVASRAPERTERTPIKVPFGLTSSDVVSGEDTAAMKNLRAEAAMIQERNPELTPKEALWRAYQIREAKTTPGQAGVVSPVDWFAGGEGGFKEAARQREEERATQPTLSSRDAVALVNIYLEEDPYGGAIENQDLFANDLADVARTISAREKIPFSDAMSLAEQMLLPDINLIKEKDTLIPNFAESFLGEGLYVYNRDKRITYDLVKQYQQQYPDQPLDKIIRAIRRQQQGQ